MEESRLHKFPIYPKALLNSDRSDSQPRDALKRLGDSCESKEKAKLDCQTLLFVNDDMLMSKFVKVFLSRRVDFNDVEYIHELYEIILEKCSGADMPPFFSKRPKEMNIIFPARQLKMQIAPNLNGGEGVRDGKEEIVEAGLLPGQGVQLLLQAGLLLLVELLLFQLLLVELLLAVIVELVTKLLLEDLDRVLLLAQQQVPAEK